MGSLFVCNEECLIYKGQHGGGETIILPFQERSAINGGMLRWSIDGP